MPMRLADVKKTVRTRADGERYLHPRLLDGESMCMQVTLALNYFQSRLGRMRREVDPEMLVRFFGNPKVARGLVTCLSATYRWRTQAFAEVLDARSVTRLAARGLTTPCDLRLFLYDQVNAHGHGFLEPDRDERLGSLARPFRLTGAKLNQLATLDAEEHAVLVQVGRAPEPREVLALYNYQVLDALLRNSAYIELEDVSEQAYRALEAACRSYAIPLDPQGATVRLHNQADAFGSFARAGQRLTRALYSAAVQAPSLFAAGRARVAVPGIPAWYVFDKHTRGALTAGSGLIRQGAPWPELRESWDRLRAGQNNGGGTAGWRLHGAPDPILSTAGLFLAPYAASRDETRVLLLPVTSPSSLADARALRQAGLELLAIVEPHVIAGMCDDLPSSDSADGADGVVAALTAHWGGQRIAAGVQALDGLLREVETSGFIAEAPVVEALGCASLAELATRLRTLDPDRGAYIPGVGLCSPTFAAAMRRGLRRRPRRKPAA